MIVRLRRPAGKMERGQLAAQSPAQPAGKKGKRKLGKLVAKLRWVA